MKLVQTIINVVTALMLAVVFVTAGVVACTVPPVTQGLSTVFARDDLSPFDRNQLNELLDLGQKGIGELIELQRKVTNFTDLK